MSTLAEEYRAMSDDWLADLHAGGGLTEEAYGILEAELRQRGLAIGLRPPEERSVQARPQTLLAHWRGQASLASAYWFIGVLGSLVAQILFRIIASIEPGPVVLLAAIVHTSYAVFALVSIWRCAWNSRWRGWGYIARAVVVLGATTLTASWIAGLVQFE